VFLSSTELHCIVTVNDIPAGHDATIGGDAFGVMYYDVTVTNPDGQTFTEIASSVPGARFGALDNGADYTFWDTAKYDGGHGIRVWGYTLPRAVHIDAATPNVNYPGIPTWWNIQVEGFSHDGAGSLTCVITLQNYDGIDGTNWTPTVTWDGSATDRIDIINSGQDSILGTYPPDGIYDVKIVNDNGTSDILRGWLTIGPQ